MDKELRVTMCQGSKGQPLATVHNLPGLDADLTPEQLRNLASALWEAATDCESKPLSQFASRNIKKYNLSPVLGR